MIEPLIITFLQSDTAISEYCGNAMYIMSAPANTQYPHIIVTADNSLDPSGIISIFDIKINIHDHSLDKEPLLNISQRIKDLLHHKTINETGNYHRMRLWFEERTHVRDPETHSPYLSIRFTGRAIEIPPGL